MRSGAIAENVLEQRMLASPGGPRVTVDVLVAPIQARCVMVATRLGLFDALEHRALNAAELAQELEVDASVLTLILRVLEGGGYLASNEGAYRLTDITSRDLLASSGKSRRAHVLLCSLFWDAIGHLEKTVREGRGADAHGYLAGQDAWHTYEAAMLEGARHTAPLIVPYIPVRSGATSLLDLGGSHGLLGALICRAHPPMRSEVVELPEAVEISRAMAREAGIDAIVEHRAGNILDDTFGSDRDVVLCSNVLHHLGASDARDVILRAAKCLRAGGTLAIVELEPSRSDVPPDSVRDATALFFRAASAGECHEIESYSEWLHEAGLGGIRVHRSRLLGYHCVISARAVG